MKSFHVVLCLLIMSVASHSQVSLVASEPLKIEWREQLSEPGNPEIPTDIILGGNRVYISLRGENGSRVIMYGHDGKGKKVLSENSFIQNLQMLDNQIYSMGGCQLIKRDIQGVIDFETCLKLEVNWTLSAVAGEIMGSGAYALHWAKMLAAYDLNGQIRWSKALGEVSQNEFLQAGGGNIYVLANISNPDLGKRLMQYDTLGIQKWSVAPDMFVSNMIADKMGNVYLVGGAGGKCYVQKYNSEGNQVWSSYTDGISYLNGIVEGDSLFVCGGVTTEKPYDQITDDDRQGAWAIYSVKTGERIFNQTFNLYPGEGYPERFRQIAYDHANRCVYLGGSYGQEGNGAVNILIKLSREGNTTGLKDEKAPRANFNIFPNPGGTKFTITCENGNSSTIDVIVRNISGQVVYRKELVCNAHRSFSLDLGKQAAGNYTIEIAESGNKTIRKIIIE